MHAKETNHSFGTFFAFVRYEAIYQTIGGTRTFIKHTYHVPGGFEALYTWMVW